MEFIKLDLFDFHFRIPEEQGVYILCQLDDNNRPIPICRFLDIDNSGILYIGCTPKANLRLRLTELRKALDFKNFKSINHTMGRKYRRNEYEKVRKRLPFESLAISIEIVPNPKMKEDELLNEYRSKFGEEPPFNSF